jgi:hypothetical protein
MRRVINSTYLSIDGVVQEPQRWTCGYRGEDAAQYAHDPLPTSLASPKIGRTR